MRIYMTIPAALAALVIALFILSTGVYAAPPFCPHINSWQGGVQSFATGAPWIKVLSALDASRAKDIGSKVFYRPYDIPSHDDGGTGDGTGMADAVLVRLSTIPVSKWPDAIGYRNEFGGGDTTTTQQFINYYDRLRAGGYTGWIVFGSYSTGVPESYRWSQTDVMNAVNKADAIETHEYFDLTEAFCHSWLACRHVRFINENPYLQGKRWFIGEAGSDRIGGNCHEDPQNRRGWRDNSKLTEAQYINQLTIYRNLCSSQVLAVFIFQQGDTMNWWDFEVMGTSVATWMQSTWSSTPTGTLAGTVTNSSGQSLSGATVTTSPGNYSATTDTNGNYTINTVPTGTYSLTASKSGYNPSTQTGKTVSQDQITTVNFTLTPVSAGALSGNVKGWHSRNLSGATVTVTPGSFAATTNSAGNYTISNLSPGSYTAVVTKSEYAETSALVTISSGQTTTKNFTLPDIGTELLTNGNFSNGSTGWSRSQSPSNIYWGVGNKVYPGTGSGSGGYSWNAYLACGGYFCDKQFTGEQHQDNVVVYAGANYSASAQVYYEPVLHPGDASDQKERLVLTFNNGAATTHTSAWHTHANANGWDRITLTDTVPSGATRMSFKVELSHTDSQWSGTGAVDECSFRVPASTILAAKSYPDGTVISLANKAVTAATSSEFWIEESDRSAGIKVSAANTLASGAKAALVSGILSTANTERYLNQGVFSYSGTATLPKPYGMSSSGIGGAPLYDRKGLGNVGMLVRVWGIVKNSYSDHFFIDDGTGRSDFTGEIGIKVASGTMTEPSTGRYVLVTGVVAVEQTGEKNVPVIVLVSITEL